MRAVVHGIIQADNRADLEKVLSFYHHEAILLPPGKGEVTGIEAIRNNYQNIFSTSRLALSLQEDELKVSGQVAYCRGRTMGTIILKADSSQRSVNDPFVMILEKNEGVWKIKRLIWN